MCIGCGRGALCEKLCTRTTGTHHPLCPVPLVQVLVAHEVTRDDARGEPPLKRTTPIGQQRSDQMNGTLLRQVELFLDVVPSVETLGHLLRRPWQSPPVVRVQTLT
eukprot:COSAG03_NODE_2172_length_3049_cov_9.823390_4_plen_106_part_00